MDGAVLGTVEPLRSEANYWGWDWDLIARPTSCWLSASWLGTQCDHLLLLPLPATLPPPPWWTLSSWAESPRKPLSCKWAHVGRCITEMRAVRNASAKLGWNWTCTSYRFTRHEILFSALSISVKASWSMGSLTGGGSRMNSWLQGWNPRALPGSLILPQVKTCLFIFEAVCLIITSYYPPQRMPWGWGRDVI